MRSFKDPPSNGVDRIRATGVLLLGNCCPRLSLVLALDNLPQQHAGSRAEGSPGSQLQNAIPSQPDIIQSKKRSLSYYWAGGAQAALVKTTEKQLPSDLRLFTSRPHPSPPLSFPSLPPSLAGSLARPLALVCLFCSSVKYSRPRKVQSSRETDRALLLISQGENLQACECSQHNHMHMLLTNAGDDPAHKKWPLQELTQAGPYLLDSFRRSPAKELGRKKSRVPKITWAFWE